MCEMVQKEPARRGRPRLHDPEEALDAALNLFWRRGFEGASLDELAAVMRMNRPSIYLAFGDKLALYRAAVARFRNHLGEALTALQVSADLEAGLLRFFNSAIRLYTSGGEARGCLVMCTAPAVAFSHPVVREDLRRIMRDLDRGFLHRVERAIHEGQLTQATAAAALARILQAILHSLALRARAGDSSAVLRRFARESVRWCIRGTDPVK